MVTVHGLEAKQGETVFAFMVLRLAAPVDRDGLIALIQQVAAIIPDVIGVLAELSDDLEPAMRLVAIPWSPPEAGHAVDAQRRLLESIGARGVEAAWFFQTGTSLPITDDDDDDDDDEDDDDDDDDDAVSAEAPVALGRGRGRRRATTEWSPNEGTAIKPLELSDRAGEISSDDDVAAKAELDNLDVDWDDELADLADDGAGDDAELAGDEEGWSHGPPPQATTAPFPVDGFPDIVDELDWEDFGLAFKLAGPWVPGESAVLLGFHALWLAPYPGRYRNAAVTIDRARNAAHLWVDRFAVPISPVELVHHLLWIVSKLHEVIPIVHARFGGATMGQKYGELMGDPAEPFVLGGNPLLAVHARGGEAAVDTWIATQGDWSNEELAQMLRELAVEIVSAGNADDDDDEINDPDASDDDDADEEADRGRYITTYAGDLLALRAAAGLLDPRTAAHLRPVLEIPAKYEHRRRAVVEILGALKDRESVPALIRILEDNPIKGALDSIGKEEFLSTTARALGGIADPSAIPALARVVAAKGSHNDAARPAAANALARCLEAAPEPRDVDDAVFGGLLETIRERNDGPLNAESHLAFGRIARALPPARRRVAARMLAEVESTRDDATPMLARQAAFILASDGELDDAMKDLLRERLHRGLTEMSWDHDATVRDIAVVLQVAELVPDLIDTADLVWLTRFAEADVRVRAHHLLDRVGQPLPPAVRFDHHNVRELDDAELVRALGETHVIGKAALITEAGRRVLTAARPAIIKLADLALQQAPERHDLLDPETRIIEATVRALRSQLDAAAIALFDRMLRHSNYHVKWALLKEPPNDERLLGGMFHVLGETWGWQETTAREWLAQFQGSTAYDAERALLGAPVGVVPDDDDDDENDDDDDEDTDGEAADDEAMN